MKNQIFFYFSFFPLCLFKWIFRLLVGCICSTFRHCVFSNVSSNCLAQRMHNHIGCTGVIFLHCVFSNVSPNCLLQRMQNHTGCIYLTFLCHLSLSLESHWLCFYLNLVVQDYDPCLEVCWLLQFLFPTDMLRGYIWFGLEG